MFTSCALLMRLSRLAESLLVGAIWVRVRPRLGLGFLLLHTKLGA